MGAAESSHWPTKLNGVEEIMLSAIVKSVAILIPTIDTSARLTPIGTRKKISPMATTTPVTPITSCGSISLSQIVKQKAAYTQRNKGIAKQIDTMSRINPIGTRKKISPIATTTQMTPITSCGSNSLSQIVKQKAASTQRSKVI